MRVVSPIALPMLALAVLLAFGSPRAQPARDTSMTVAGMTLEVRQGPLIVAVVRPASAAAAAGLLAGDAPLVANRSYLIHLRPISPEAALHLLPPERRRYARL